MKVLIFGTALVDFYSNHITGVSNNDKIYFQNTFLSPNVTFL